MDRGSAGHHRPAGLWSRRLQLERDKSECLGLRAARGERDTNAARTLDDTILRGFGLKVGPTTSPSFAARINHLVDGQTSLEVVAAALLSLHAVALREFKSLEK